ncbi:MAG: NAD(P)/FAD-dependent oxidoreductase [Saprospiraceae bacterium]
MKETQVCIVGAGPAGLSAAMNLNKLGINCLLVDKSTFPRDKVCGECFDGHVFHVLRRLNPSYVEEMHDKGILLKSWDYWFGDEYSRKLKTAFDKNATPRILTKRTDFDTFLINKIKEMPHVEVMENVNIAKVEQVKDGTILTTKDGKTKIKTQLTIGASGATSTFFNKITSKKKREGDTYNFVRAYFKNVGTIPNNEVVFHIFYEPMIVLYICPLPNGIVSVEVGVKKSEGKKHNINLRKKLFELLKTYEPVVERFRNAELIEKTKGASIQLSYRKAKISGERFMLAGSAAQSVHPVTGYGAGHAMAAGEIAAQTAKQAIENQRFDAKFLKQYDKAVYKKLGNEILLSRILTYIFDHPKTCLPILFKVGGSITDLLTHEDFSQEFLNPAFYLKRLTGISA